MSAIIHLALKDLRLVRRDWLGLFFIIGFPICMGLFFGLIFSGFSSGPSSLPLAVVDEDQSDRSKQFIELLEGDGEVRVEFEEKAIALDQVRKGERSAVLVIPKGFGETAGVIWAEDPPALQLGTDPSRQAEAGMLEGYIMKAMGQITMERFQDVDSMRPFVEQSMSSIQEDSDMPATQRLLLTTMMSSLEAFLDSMEDAQTGLNSDSNQLADNMPSFQLANIEHLQIGNKQNANDDSNDSSPGAGSTPETNDPDSASKPDGASEASDGGETNDQESEESESTPGQNSPWDISFPSAMMWGVLGCVAGFAISIVRERTHGTLTRLQIAPINRSQILLGKALACFLAVVGVVAVMTALGIALGMQPQNYAMLVVAALCVAFCFVGLMMTMSVIGKSEEAVAGCAWGFNVFAAMFGGGMIPLAFMPEMMRPLSHLSPVKWSILALEGAIWRDFSWTEILFPCAVLIVIGCCGFALGSWILTKRQ